MKAASGKMALIAMLLLLALGLVLWWRRSQPRPMSPEAIAAASAQATNRPSQPLPGDQIMAGYGLPETSPKQDLQSLANTLSNLVLLIKADDPFRLGANEEFAAALRGRNRHRLRFVREDHPCFNNLGQLVDRWQSPLFFHALDASRIDIRSAGPDRVLWTDDDLHRRYDGQFLKGAKLSARSLDQAGKR